MEEPPQPATWRTLGDLVTILLYSETLDGRKLIRQDLPNVVENVLLLHDVHIIA